MRERYAKKANHPKSSENTPTHALTCTDHPPLTDEGMGKVSLVQ
eukprot:CAMPEP_0171748662 /NCGR_PEP_ID=MMETSP0991-20121206/40253_1 /TAXON_ID=483369 /ORGANISM="non described non described, Strain CCMP2098" /LENGTH=43 /DNA_ID= /DNA_START= /DNA_END= /DNA_ORIENTATION=